MENLNPPQQVFDYIVEFIIKQGQASMDDLHSCRYRHNGLKCAAGCLIPDDVYEPRMETNSFGYVVNNFKRVPRFSQNIMDVIATLQQAHDRAAVASQPNFIKNFLAWAKIGADALNLKWKF